MALWKTKTAVQLWTNSESKAGTTQVGVIVETGASRVIKERACLLVVSSNYYGKYIERVGLEAYVPPEEQPGAPVVEITRVEGTVDGEPFTWQP